MDYGILSIIPPVLTIVLAFVTRQVVLSLFIGAFSGALILSGGNPIHAFTNMGEEFIIGALADSSHAAIIIFTMVLGGLVILMTHRYCSWNLYYYYVGRFRDRSGKRYLFFNGL